MLQAHLAAPGRRISPATGDARQMALHRRDIPIRRRHLLRWRYRAGFLPRFLHKAALMTAHLRLLLLAKILLGVAPVTDHVMCADYSFPVRPKVVRPV